MYAVGGALPLDRHAAVITIGAAQLWPRAGHVRAQGVASNGGLLVTDLHPHEVDGRAQIALLHVDAGDVPDEEEGEGEEGPLEEDDVYA